MNEPQDRLYERDARAYEDRKHDRKPCQPLASGAAKEESHPEWYCRQRIAEVVNQVSKQRDAGGDDIDRHLDEGGRGEDG